MAKTARPRRKTALDRAKTRAAAATVRLEKGGQGVLVAGGFILTAAHCVRWEDFERHALGYPHLERFSTAAGQPLVAQLCALEPLADVAAFCCPDSQAFFAESMRFDAYQLTTAPVPLYCGDLAVGIGGRVGGHVLTHKGSWVRAGVTLWLPSGRLGIGAAGQLEGGTSGGPVINDAGELLGVVSTANETKGNRCEGSAPFLWAALPRWLSDQIREAQQQDAP